MPLTQLPPLPNTPDGPTPSLGDTLTLKSFSGKKRGSIALSGKVLRLRKNGTFDVLYEDGVKEVGVETCSIIPQQTETKDEEQPQPEQDTEQKEGDAEAKGQEEGRKHGGWSRVKTGVRFMGVMKETRTKVRRRVSTEQEVELLNEAIRDVDERVKKTRRKTYRKMLFDLTDLRNSKERALAQERAASRGECRNAVSLLTQQDNTGTLVPISTTTDLKPKPAKAKRKSKVSRTLEHLHLHRGPRSGNGTCQRVVAA
jgi:hypothetical protein